MVVIIADPEFEGDREAFRIKDRRAREDFYLTTAFNTLSPDLVQRTWIQTKALRSSEAGFQRWCALERTRRREEKNRERQRRLVAAQAGSGDSHRPVTISNFNNVIVIDE